MPYYNFTLQDLLNIEDEAPLDDFFCPSTGLLLWPLVRVAFFREIISDLVYSTAISSVSNGPSAFQKASALFRAELWNIGLQYAGMRASLLCVTDSVADRFIDGRRFNRLSDPLLNCYDGNSVCLLEQYDWKWPFPRHKSRVLLHGPSQARIAVIGHLRARIPNVKAATVELVNAACSAAQRILGWNLTSNRKLAFEHFVARKIGGLPAALALYRNMVESIQPSFLLASGASYGPLMPLIYAAREVGACVVEFQHGAISRGHDAYNFGDRIFQSKVYRSALPDYFLSYGRWWESQVNLPVKMVTVGNPARPEGGGVGRGGRPFIIILSDGIEFNKYAELAHSMIDYAKQRGLRILIRPHPLERQRVSSMTFDDEDIIALDDSSTIYDAVSGAEIVISEVSTGLFDAVGLCKKILAWRTAKSIFAYPVLPFSSFSSIDELFEVLESADQSEEERLGDELWEKNWESNFKNFIQMVE
ncbi:hypothetical protein [Chitinolyticbacter meiyuanensis]|uniref:hypothetical protein n=1 Tax=Chitinolyticbacter meiyuanensis TaxID=682798 RepID=UPI0011E5C49C|nr:hypothetical protein [Chitinolyticbacter meiyuanensis]